MEMKVSIDFRPESNNKPNIIISEVEIPLKGWIFKPHEKGHRTIWTAQNGIFIVGFVENPYDRTGFGGRKFNLDTENGTYVLEGPWSGNESTYTDVLGYKVTHVILEGYNIYPLFVEESFIKTKLPQNIALVEGTVTIVSTCERCLKVFYTGKTAKTICNDCLI